MPRLFLAVSILAVVLTACGTPATGPSAQPSHAPASFAPATPGPVASPGPTPVPTPSETPTPTATPKPTPLPVALDADERYLLDGVHRGATDCQPVRDELPPKAAAGIECESDDPAVARIGFYLFASDKAMLDAYFARMDAEDVERDKGGCIDGEGEGSYIPYEGPSPDRDGCFVNAEGYANYRATISGTHLYIGILGRSADMRALADFAWRGNQDTPGNPTLWIQPGG
jgi:hypothetical protein